MSDELISIFDIAEHLGIDVSTVYLWISTKKMPANLVGGKWLFDRAVVDGWAQETGIGATEDRDPSDG